MEELYGFSVRWAFLLLCKPNCNLIATEALLKLIFGLLQTPYLHRFLVFGRRDVVQIQRSLNISYFFVFSTHRGFGLWNARYPKKFVSKETTSEAALKLSWQPGPVYVTSFHPTRNWWEEEELATDLASTKPVIFQAIIHFTTFNAIISEFEACLARHNSTRVAKHGELQTPRKETFAWIWCALTSETPAIIWISTQIAKQNYKHQERKTLHEYDAQKPASKPRHDTRPCITRSINLWRLVIHFLAKENIIHLMYGPEGKKLTSFPRYHTLSVLLYI